MAMSGTLHRMLLLLMLIIGSFTFGFIMHASRTGNYYVEALTIALQSPFHTPRIESNIDDRDLPVSVPDSMFNARAREDVRTEAPWGAPIVWDGTFQPDHVDRLFEKRKTRVALTVFALGRYLDKYLARFLTTAEKHFMVGHNVTYYAFVENASRVPHIEPLAPGRSLAMVEVEKRARWQDISMDRMKMIGDLIEGTASRSHDYIFCFDVDQHFTARWGAEALGDTVALLQAWYFDQPPEAFTYERRPESVAYIAPGAGDFYYHAAVFGGRCAAVLNVTRGIYAGITRDRDAGVEALWHDESHLNRYFLDHRPSKLLSPEYCWDPKIGMSQAIRLVRLEWAPKEYNELRENEG
ncbi:N-acetyllactosaminide alpha-1,3-galactosyltransferase-like [Lethenteron reissneri]|uniref:N-acetyllactosaminide alpha-1,3-galactosyltransferase-like n=1 Tax=Lethenteron reissneri TaxID=7753 RepID=UPI002AB685A3|nr:N-acetyllactosaminide alpha-1,3-galactosyltransferase-like [Lethenteron reissneri]